MNKMINNFYDKGDSTIVVTDVNGDVATYSRVKTCTVNGNKMMRSVVSGNHYIKTSELSDWYFCGNYPTLD